jgi:nucleotide-binding universal stress UspA family protein
MVQRLRHPSDATAAIAAGVYRRCRQRPTVTAPRQAERFGKMPSILCTVDFSDESLIARRRAATIAAHSGARLAALHVADALLVHAAKSAFHTEVVVHESARALQDAVDEIRSDAAASGLDICVYVLVGDPAAEICTFCRHHVIDLIVMASHQVKRYRRLFGSVADGVIRSAPAPVLVFPAQPSFHASTVCVTVHRAGRAASDA